MNNPATFRAYLGTNAAGHVCLCAWCPDKPAAEAAVHAAGRTVSHGICHPCRRRHFTATQTRLQRAGARQTWVAA